MIEIIRGGSMTSIWLGKKLLITLDYYDLKRQCVKKFPSISVDWNPG